MLFRPGHAREHEFRFQTEPENADVDHARFVSLYDRSANVEGYSPFNTALYICRRFPDSILSIHGGKLITVDADGSVTSVAIDHGQMTAALVNDFGISEQAAAAVPVDEPGVPDLG